MTKSVKSGDSGSITMRVSQSASLPKKRRNDANALSIFTPDKFLPIQINCQRPNIITQYFSEFFLQLLHFAAQTAEAFWTFFCNDRTEYRGVLNANLI